MRRTSIVLVIALLTSLLASPPATADLTDLTTGDVDKATQNGVAILLPFSQTTDEGVDSITVRLRMTHPDVEDLDISLQSPTGRRWNLLNNLVQGGADLGSGSTDCSGTWLELQEGHDHISTASAPYTGTWSPYGTVDPAGTGDAVRSGGQWYLEIYDRGVSDGGTASTGTFHCGEMDLGTDTTDPVLTLEAPESHFVLGDQYVVEWDATDENDIRNTNIAHFGKRFDEEYNDLLSERSASTFRTRIPSSPGWSHCVYLMAIDRTGNASAPDTTCFGMPADDGQLQASGGFKRKFSNGAYGDDVSKAAKKGAALRFADGYFTNLALVATKCSGCGSVKVYVDGLVAATISLSSATTKKRRVIPIDFDPGDVVHVARTVDIVTTSDKPVLIEGLGVIDAYVT